MIGKIGWGPRIVLPTAAVATIGGVCYLHWQPPKVDLRSMKSQEQLLEPPKERSPIVEAKLGDIVEQLDVDAIVNAANSELKLGGGVAGAIRAKGGKVQAECDAIRERVPTGGAVITHGWGEKPKWIIHAVGPRYSEARRQQCIEELYQAYQSALRVAEEKGIRRIALPLLSSEIFGFTAEKGSSKIAWRSVNDYLTQHPHAFDLVRFVSLRETEPYRALIECMAD